MQLKLSQLTHLIEATLSEVFYGKVFAVIAETSEIKKSGAGHYYFDLIEKDGRNIVAKMNAVIWKGYSQIITDFELATGQRFERNIELLMKVEVRFHEVYGLQLQVIDIDSKYTLGKLELERQETLQKLVKENSEIIELIDGEFITKNKKLFAPIVFQRIALVTAPNSDGQRDFKHELENNPYGYKFHITEFLTQIQGKDADKLIIHQLNLVASTLNKFDAVVIVRGGGSQTDFSSFDTYEMGRTIAGFDLPVLAGIGHERNVSIADMLCYASVKTPTKAAAYIIEHNKNFEEEILELQSRITEKVTNELEDKNQKLTQLTDDFNFYVQNILGKQNHQLEKFEIALKHLNPENVLKRGFAIVTKENKIVTNPDLINKGDEINVLMKQTNIAASVTGKNKL
ncbi:MAG: exodeoxyribonuclease VII large subunit [Bacteroidia bacterium]